MSGRCIARGAAVLAICLAAGPLALQAEIFDPCLVASNDTPAFRTAFEADGWALAQGDLRRPALHTLGEAQEMVSFLPSFHRAADLTAFLKAAHKYADRDVDWHLVMTRHDLAAGVSIYQDGDVVEIRCVLAGLEVPGVDAALTSQDPQLADMKAVIGNSLTVLTENRQREGFDKLRIKWIAITPSIWTRSLTNWLLAERAIEISYTFSLANPPKIQADKPPMPPQTSEAGRKVRKRR